MKIIDTHVHIGGEKVGFIMNEEMVTTMMNVIRLIMQLFPMGILRK